MGKILKGGPAAPSAEGRAVRRPGDGAGSDGATAAPSESTKPAAGSWLRGLIEALGLRCGGADISESDHAVLSRIAAELDQIASVSGVEAAKSRYAHIVELLLLGCDPA